jgi:alkanesulfonate monooxygenase SsuD/methylene tetrahydromethanopterin reductase-like flavin-dependent oxidoreductase (luciferase family)
MAPEIGIACSLRTANGSSLLAALEGAASAAEDLGVASWWGPGDREVVADRSHDAMLGLHVVVTATRRMRIALSGDIPSLYSSPVRAKQIASLDWFSAGRVEHGIDLAPPPVALRDPLRPEIDDHLGHVLDQTAAMSRLWTQRRASYPGTYVSFDGAIALPKPVGDRTPTTHVRATTAEALRRYVDTCGAPDGWIVRGGGGEDVDLAEAVLREVLGDSAAGVRRTWVVPASDHRALRDAAQERGVDELVADFDHVPSPDEIETVVR